MPIRKKGNIKVKTSPNRYGIEQTGYTFYSYDKNSAALVFTFIDSDNAPVNLSEADVRLLLISDNGDEFPVDKDDIDVISAIRGTARYVIPENLLGYEGKITGHIYLDFEDGSHTDEGQFTFNIKRSMISDVLPEAGDKYVQDFEDVKERVEQAGDSATKDIEKAKDDAESQIGEYAGEVESAKDSAVEDIDKALPKVEDKLEDIRVKVSEVDISDTNLLLNSAKLKAGKLHQKNPSKAEYDYLNVGKSLDDLSSGTTITISFDIETTEFGVDSLMVYNTNHKGPKEIGKRYIRDIPAGITRQSVTTLVRDNDNPDQEDSYIEFFTEYGTDQLFEITNISINKGSYALDWKPNPYEIVTQDQYDKLANAIINLGGSI